MLRAVEGFKCIQGAFDVDSQQRLLAELRSVLQEAPLYAPAMPRTGKPLSVRMSNCGALGWVTDRAGGYRYQAVHPVTGRPWPPIPPVLLQLWAKIAPSAPPPEACLINYYTGNAKLGSHVDADETNRSAPVVSVSLGDDAVFHVGGLRRGDTRVRCTLHSGDVVVLAGTARSAYHGIDRVLAGTSGLLAESGRFNLTLRRVTPTG